SMLTLRWSNSAYFSIIAMLMRIARKSQQPPGPHHALAAGRWRRRRRRTSPPPSRARPIATSPAAEGAAGAVAVAALAWMVREKVGFGRGVGGRGLGAGGGEAVGAHLLEQARGGDAADVGGLDRDGQRARGGGGGTGQGARFGVAGRGGKLGRRRLRVHHGVRVAGGDRAEVDAQRLA